MTVLKCDNCGRLKQGEIGDYHDPPSMVSRIKCHGRLQKDDKTFVYDFRRWREEIDRSKS